MSLLSTLRAGLVSISADVALATHKYVMTGDFQRMMGRVAEVEVGTFTGTGVAQTKAVQGDPRLVLFVNVTQQCLGVHISGMATASFFAIDNGGVAYVAVNGITLGTDSFIVGTDARLNTNMDSAFWATIS